MPRHVWVGIGVGRGEVRLLARTGTTTLLEARLSAPPDHPRALRWFLESLALWQGMPVRAVLYAVDTDEASVVHSLRDWFPDFGGPLYSIEWTDLAPRLGNAERSHLPDGLDELAVLQVLHALEVGP